MPPNASRTLGITAICVAVLVYAAIAYADGDVCWRPTITRGVGAPLGCAPDEDYDAGLCYPKCEAGYKGVGPVCWKACPEGYRDDPFHCGKGTYGRGVGSPLPCDSDEESDAGLCYRKCDPGYQGVGPVCWQQCPPDTRDIGVSCEKPNQARGVGKPIHVCAEGKEEDAGLCYTPCSGGYTGVGPVCWAPCPETFPVNCGAACAKTNEACAQSTGSQTYKSVETIVKLIMEEYKGAADAGVQAGKSFNLPLCTFPMQWKGQLVVPLRHPQAVVPR